jgi:hypothetical protein
MVRYFTPIFDPYKDTRGSLSDPCMRLKTGFYSMFSSELGFVLKLYVSPLPVILSIFVVNKSLDAIFIVTIIIKQIKKKADRFLSNTKNIHKLHPLFCVLYTIHCSVKSLFFKCFYGISAMQVLYIFFLTFTNKYERMYKC